MSFKLSDLKNWTVKRSIEVLPGVNFEVEIAVKTREEGQAIVMEGDDLNTCKRLIVGISGFHDEKGKEQSLSDDLWNSLAEYPALVHKLASEVVAAQYDAALKN